MPCLFLRFGSQPHACRRAFPRMFGFSPRKRAADVSRCPAAKLPHACLQAAAFGAVFSLCPFRFRPACIQGNATLQNSSSSAQDRRVSGHQALFGKQSAHKREMRRFVMLFDPAAGRRPFPLCAMHCAPYASRPGRKPQNPKRPKPAAQTPAPDSASNPRARWDRI
jgi:hypothetical protein